MDALTKYTETFEAYLGIQSGTVIKTIVPLSVAVVVVSHLLHSRKRRTTTTSLNGPKSKSFIFGLMRDLSELPDLALVYEGCEKEYGSVFAVPGPMGSRELVLCDLKAVAQLLARDTDKYRHPPNMRFALGLFGKNLLWAEGEVHKRQRRALSLAFSNAAIRNVTPVFYDSADKLKQNWDASFEGASTDSVIIEVQEWMNHVSLDSIGIAGFSHDFHTLSGAKSSVAEAFDSFGNTKPSVAAGVAFVMASMFPFLMKLPNKRNQMFQAITTNIGAIADELLQRARAEKEKETNVEEGKRDRSIIGTLIRSETASESIHLDFDEIVAQNLLIVAGYETTSFTLTWTLIELCRHPEIQDKVREEVIRHWEVATDLYDFTNDYWPCLDAVVRETLRLHPALPEISRKAHEDDILPLASPITDARGCTTNNILIAKGTNVRIPIMTLNTSEILWGPDAKVFSPDRWINDDVSKRRATDIHAGHHILTFLDGPRMCLGRNFAVMEIKAVLSVLIRNFYFELPDGPTTKIEHHIGITARPKVAGQDGAKVPLIVRRV